MGGFLPKPVSKVSWTEVLSQRGGESHACRSISKTSDTPADWGGGSEEDKETYKQETYVPISLNSCSICG